MNGKKGKRRAIRPLRGLIPGRYDGALPFGSRLNVTTVRFGLKRCGGEADNTGALMGDERLRHLYRGRSLVLGELGWSPRRTVPGRDCESTSSS